MNALDPAALTLMRSEIRAASYHEAGHAFAFEHFGKKVAYITIAGDDPRPFICVPRKRYGRPARSLKELQVAGIISCAGEEAERLYRAGVRRAKALLLEPLEVAAGADRQTVEFSVRTYVEDRKIDPRERWLIIRRVRKAARALVRANWPVIREIAEALDDYADLDGKSVRRIMREFGRKRRVTSDAATPRP